jgi:ATP:ADP antiporter, AAA family
MARPEPAPADRTRQGSAIPFAALLFLLVAAHTMLETARDSLFLTGQPVSHLPWILLLVTAAVLALTPVQRLLWSASHRSALSLTLAGTGAVTLLFWLASGWRGAVVAFYVWTALFSSLVFVQFWLTADEAFGLDDAKRMFGVIAAGGLVGAITGSTAARLLLQVAEPVLLVPASAAVTFVALALSWLALPAGGIGTAAAREPVVSRIAPAAVQDPYLRLLALLTLLAAASGTLLDFLFKATVVANTAPERIPRVIANVQMGQSALALLVELLLLRFLFRRAGVTRSLALLPVLLLASTAGYAVVGSVALLFVLKMLDGGVRPSIHRVGSELLYLPVASAERRLIKPSIDTVGQRGGQAAASVILLATGGFPVTARLGAVTALLAAVAVGWVIATRALRARYLVRFQAQLGAGRIDALSVGPLDLAAAEILVAALGSPRTVEVLTALEVLARGGRAGLVPAFILHHRDSSVVVAALRVLAPLRRPDVETMLPSLLRHAAPVVRCAAAELWLPGGRATTELAPLLEDPDLEVRSTALVALSGGRDSGRTFRAGLVFVARHGSIPERRLLAWAIARAPRPDLLRIALWMFRWGDREVRQELLRGVDGFGALPPRFIVSTVALLEDPVLRPGARRALRAIGGPARDLLQTLLLREQTPYELARELPTALAEFPPEQAAAALLRRIAQPRGGLDRFRSLRALNQLRRAHPRLPLHRPSLATALEIELAAVQRNRSLRRAAERLGLAADGNPAARLLLELLEDKEHRALERVFRSLDLLLPGRQVERAFHATRSADPGQRAAAREVLLEMLPAHWRDRVLEALRPPAGAAGPAARGRPFRAADLRRPPMSFFQMVSRQRSGMVHLLVRRLARERGWTAALAAVSDGPFSIAEVADD